MFEDFWKVDKSMGESRFDQVLGVIILVGLFVFSILHILKVI